MRQKKKKSRVSCVCSKKSLSFRESLRKKEKRPRPIAQSFPLFDLFFTLQMSSVEVKLLTQRSGAWLPSPSRFLSLFYLFFLSFALKRLEAKWCTVNFQKHRIYKLSTIQWFFMGKKNILGCCGVCESKIIILGEGKESKIH